MPGFPGFDTDIFPGTPAMAWLRANTNLLWCGYYLAPAPSHADTSWMGRRPSLLAAGWGLAPIYVGQQIQGAGSHNLTAAQGRTDGAEAIALIRAEGFAPGSAVYLDLEDGPPLVAPRTDYVGAWTDTVRAGGFHPGVYCSHGFAEDVRRSWPGARIWAFRVGTTQEHPFPGTVFPDPDPAGCGAPSATIWQHAQNCRLSPPPGLAPLVVDLDSARTPDPGAPDPPSGGS